MTTSPARLRHRIRSLALLIAAALPPSAPAVELGSESFEGSSGYLASFFSDGSADYCDRVQVSGAGGDSTPIGFGSANGTQVTGHDGAWVIVSEDVDDDLNPLGAAGPAIIRLADIDVAGHGNLQVTVRLASNTAYNSSWELDDNIRVEYAFDGDSGGIAGPANPTLLNGSYSVAGRFNGSNQLTGGSSGFGIGPILDDNLSGAWEAPEATQIPVNGAMTDFTFDIPGAGSAVSIQLVINQSGGSEELAVDYIRVTGDAAATDPPVLAGIEAAAATWTEGGAATQVSNTITVTDPDSNLTGATVSIQSGFNPGEDSLGVAGALPAGILATYAPATGTMSLGGAASPAAYQAALRQVTYGNSSINPNLFQTRTIRFQVSDGTASSNFQSRNLMVTGFVASATIPHLEDFDTDGNGVRYTSNRFTDGQTTPQDYFERTGINPHPGHSGGPYTFTAPQAGGYFASEDVDSPDNPLGPGQPAILRLPDLDASGLGNLRVSVFLADNNDGSNLDGGERIEVQAAFDGNSGGTALGSGSYTTFGRFVGDPASNAMRQDTNLDGSSGDPADQSSPTLSSTMTEYSFDIPGTGNLLSVQIVVGNTGGTEELAFDHIEVTGTAVGPPPVLAGIEPAPAGFTEGDSPLQVTGTITATDADDTELVGATIQITGGFQPGEDLLAVSGPLPAGITEGTFNPADGSIGLAGPAAIADYQAALRLVTYHNTNLTNPDVGDRSVTFQVSDATSDSNIVARTIEVTGVVAPSIAPYLEDFDTDGDGSRYTSNSFTDGQPTPQDYFERTDANPHPGHGALTFTPPQSGGYWTSEDVDNAGNQLGEHGIVRLRDLGMTGFTGREVRIFLAAGGNGFDTTEQVEIQYAYDANSGGTDLTTGSYTTVGRFINSGGTLRQDTDLDGVSTDPEDATSPVLNDTMTEYAFPLPDTGNILSLQVRVTGTSGSENVSFDHLFVDGTAPVETVVNADDDGPGSLRQTIADSLPGTTILFDAGLNGATITLTTGQLLIDKNLTIDGSALARGITISGGGLSRVLQVTAGTSATLEKLTIADGSAPSANGGGISNSGTLAVRNCALLRNRGFGGGAIASIGAGASLEVVNSTVTANSALFAGAILSRDGAFDLVHSTVSGNVAAGGTGALVLERGTATIENSIVAGNRGPGTHDLGGILTVVTAAGANLIGTHDGNYAADFPADGILIGTNAAPVDPLLAPFGRYGGCTGTMHPLTGSPAFDSGAVTPDTPATDQRGLPRNVGGSPDIGAVEGGPVLLVTNTGDSGPGSLRQAILDATPAAGTRIHFDPTVFPATITLSSPASVTAGRLAFIDASDIPGGVTVSGANTNHHFTINGSSEVAMTALTLTAGDSGTASGGALIVDGATLVLNRSSITGNTAGDDGGAILLYGGGTVALNDSLVADNKAANLGGGVMNFFGGITATNTTFAGNQASQGAAMWVQGNSGLRLTHTTVSANTGPQAVVSFVPATLENSIVAGNSAVNYSSGQPVTDLGNNLLDGDPLLAPLADYGGPTRSMPPRLDSPALNEAAMLAGTPLRDQRGFVRPQDGAPDIGAVERAEMFASAGPVLVNDTSILLDDTVRRDDTTADTLFFRFTVDPLSNFTTEDYVAALQLYQAGTERLGVGNAFDPWAYSAFNTAGGFVDLNSSTPEGGSAAYEYVRSGVQRTIVFRVDYVPGGLDTVSAWLSPDLNLPDFAQLPTLLTVFSADASFDQLFLRHAGPGGGWTFSNITVSELSPFSDTVSFAALFPGLDPDGDENGDGLSNYFHYASGDDPFDPALRPTLSGGVYTHSARINGSDVFFTGYEFSTNLEDFDPMVEGVHFNFLPTTTLSDGVEQVTIVPLFDPLLDPRVFWRFGFAPAP